MLLAFFFICIRFVMQCYCVYAYDKDWLMYMWYEKPGVPDAYKALLVFLASCVMLNVVLNVWWSWLIVRQFSKVVFGAKDLNADASFTGDEGEVQAKKTKPEKLD